MSGQVNAIPNDARGYSVKRLLKAASFSSLGKDTVQTTPLSLFLFIYLEAWKSAITFHIYW